MWKVQDAFKDRTAVRYHAMFVNAPVVLLTLQSIKEQGIRHAALMKRATYFRAVGY
jgi:hypothetical protein